MRSQSRQHVMLSIGLATLTVLAVLDGLGTLWVAGQGARRIWPLTTDGMSRIAGWSPDGHTVLVSHWGRVAANETTRQALSELWAITVQDGLATKLSNNALYPAYDAEQARLAYLSFTGDGGWEARVLNLADGEERSWAPADWHMPPVWISDTLAVAQSGRVWLRSQLPAATAFNHPPLPAGARVHLATDGVHIAWSDGRHLWAARVDDMAREVPPLLASETHVLSFVWSPDGGQLAYVVADEGPSPELWVAHVDMAQAPTLLVRGRMERFSAPTWSPDGRTLAFSRTPTGAANAPASDIWLTSTDGHNQRRLLDNDLEESSPVWSPDGRYLAFHRAGDVWMLDMDCGTTCATSSLPSDDAGTGQDIPDHSISMDHATVAPMAQKTPPATIRVIHDAANPCRAVPPGQIDVIDFEEYVKRVVPQEMWPSWASEALKAQAVAARTYGWKHTLIPPNPNWDVTDWTRHQAMCDVTYSSTNEAVEATGGQYVAWRGDVVYAMYSAENGSPTKTYVTATFPQGVPYLMAVDDPVSFGQSVRGHGSGLSQEGAQRWADWHGWGYQQILRHYYTDVTVELPSTAGPVPLGGLTLPWSDYFITSNWVYLAANASDEMGAVSAVGFYVVSDTTTLLVTDTVGSDGWDAVWDASAVNDTASTSLTLSLLVADGEGHVQSQTEVAHIGLDRQPPTGTMTTSSDTYSDTLTVTLSSLSATDPNPGSGVHGMAFSNEAWAWEGEELPHEQGSGQEVDDEDALNGRAWCGLVGNHSAGSWYGPYFTDLPPGRAYRAYFRLKTNAPTIPIEVATLDVVDDAGERVLGLRRVRGTDFRTADTYQEFAVDFSYAESGASGLEFRTAFRATADLCLDRVLIVTYPVDVTNDFQWYLTPGDGSKTITAKFVDRAGNVSADITRRITILDTLPPGNWQGFAPEWWAGGGAPACSVRVMDQLSGLNVDSARYRLSTDGGVSWSDWAAATCTGISGTTEIQTIAAPAVAFGQPSETANHIEFQIADMRGHTGSMSYIVRSKIAYVPLVLKGDRT